jgi:hypothetical protein
MRERGRERLMRERLRERLRRERLRRERLREIYLEKQRERERVSILIFALPFLCLTSWSGRLN